MVHLTKAERAIVLKLCEGMRNKEIAEARGTNVQVIKNQLRMIYDKTGMDGRLELVLAAMAHPEWFEDDEQPKRPKRYAKLHGTDPAQLSEADRAGLNRRVIAARLFAEAEEERLTRRRLGMG